jgi:pre-mRNA cleavage complex 2 protein Pcf11
MSIQNQPQLPSRSTPQPPANVPGFQPPYYGGYGMPQPGISVDALNDDIQNLIAAFKAEVARTPQDPSIQTRLKALLDLQSILQTQHVSQDQLEAIKNQIAALAVTIRAPPAQTSTPVPIPQPVAVAPPAAAPKVSLDSILGPGALAALLARGSATPPVSTPQPPPATIAIRPPPTQRQEPQQSATPVPSDPMSLLGMLRQAGMLGAVTPSSGSTPVPIITPSVPLSFPPPPPLPGMGFPTMENLTSDITLKASSLKQCVSHLGCRL